MFKLSDKYHDWCEVNAEKLGEHNSIAKTASELSAVLQPMCVDLTSSCPIEQSENKHFCPTFDVIRHHI